MRDVSPQASNTQHITTLKVSRTSVRDRLWNPFSVQTNDEPATGNVESNSHMNQVWKTAVRAGGLLRNLGVSQKQVDQFWVAGAQSRRTRTSPQ